MPDLVEVGSLGYFQMRTARMEQDYGAVVDGWVNLDLEGVDMSEHFQSVGMMCCSAVADPGCAGTDPGEVGRLVCYQFDTG